MRVIGAEEQRARHRDVDGGDLDAGGVEDVHHLRPEIHVGLEFDDVVDIALHERLRVGERRRPIEAIVGDLQGDAGGIGVLLNALFDLDAERNVPLKIGEAEDVALAVLGRRDLYRVSDHGLELVGAQHRAVEIGRIEAVKVICNGGSREHNGRRHAERERPSEFTHSVSSLERRSSPVIVLLPVGRKLDTEV